jgi:AraC family transcriptional regulator
VNSTRSAGPAGTKGPAVADYPAGARMPARVIGDFEFVWMLRGDARFVTEGEELVLSPGRLLLVPPGVRHAFVWDGRRPSRHGYVHFPHGLVDVQDAVGVRSRRMTDRDPQAGLCAYLIWLGRERPLGWEQRVDETLRFLLLVFSSRLVPGDDATEAVPVPLRAVIDHLRHEWAQMPLRRIGVDELALAGRVSRSYLNRLFRAEFEISAASALESLRCSRAETLLLRTDMTIGAIARECGFADLFHFSHRFTRRYGVSPSTYRSVGTANESALDHPGVRRLALALWE